MRARDLKVGIFVLAGLVMTALVVFLIGDERRLFASAVQFTSSFEDVQGLKPGAPVRMGGIDIGHVQEVGYGEDPTDTIVYVALSVVESEAQRIKIDSRALIVSKGLLGDKMIEVTMGESDQSVPPGGEIIGEPPSDMMGKVSGMADKAEVAIDNIAKVTEGLADEQLQEDFRQSVHSMRIVLDEVAGGEGYPNRLLTQKDEAERISRAIDSLNRSADELSLTLAESRAIVSRIKTGPGFAHSVIYQDGPQPQIEQFGNAAGELAETLRGVREGHGLARDFLYGAEGDTQDTLKNVAAISEDLRVIVRNVRDGKGTVGALLVDPSIYEDMKLVLGNVQRNDVLRALVRYSIKKDEQQPKVEVGKAE